MDSRFGSERDEMVLIEEGGRDHRPISPRRTERAGKFTRLVRQESHRPELGAPQDREGGESLFEDRQSAYGGISASERSGCSFPRDPTNELPALLM